MISGAPARLRVYTPGFAPLPVASELWQKLCQHQCVHGKQGKQRNTSSPQYLCPNGFKHHKTTAGHLWWAGSSCTSPALTGLLEHHIPGGGFGNAVPEDNNPFPIYKSSHHSCSSALVQILSFSRDRNLLQSEESSFSTVLVTERRNLRGNLKAAVPWLGIAASHAKACTRFVPKLTGVYL